MIGPPGAGKSLLASCLPAILPPLSPAEALEVSMVQSVAGTLEEGRISRARPFRAPHHSASMAALTGGGLRVKPGEVSLAHLGVLFLDELPEFQRAVLDSLRQPLETGKVDVARANAHVSYPANVQLIAAMNPCRCGHLGDPALACSRAPRCAADYQGKVSGPMLDRIDPFASRDRVRAHGAVNHHIRSVVFAGARERHDAPTSNRYWHRLRGSARVGRHRYRHRRGSVRLHRREHHDGKSRSAC